MATPEILILIGLVISRYTAVNRLRARLSLAGCVAPSSAPSSCSVYIQVRSLIGR